MHTIRRKNGARWGTPLPPLRLRSGLGSCGVTAQRNNEGFVEALAAMVNPIKIVILIPKESTIAWDAR